MTLRTRKYLFYGLVALFFIVGIGVTLYAQGWRLNLATFKTEKVGAIFVRSYPDDAQIILDRKPIQNTSSFLSRGTLISNLFPKDYTLTLKADGYDPWAETATVAPTLVAEMKYAVLVPSNASSAAEATNVAGFFEADGSIVTDNASGSIAVENNHAGTSTSPSGIVIGHGTIVAHSTDFSNIIIKSPGGIYSAYDLTNATSTGLSPLFAKASITNKAITAIMIDPYDNNNVIVQTAQKFYTVNLQARTVTAFETATAGQNLESPLAISSSWLAWANYNIASSSSQIVIYDTFSGNTVDSSLSLPGHIKDLAWIRSTELGILQEDGELYRYDVPSETLTKVADDVRSFYPTNDGAMIAALESRSVEVFSLTTSDYYRFNLPEIGDVESLIWYKDEAHLIVEYPDHVSFLDFEDLSLRNFTTVSEGSDPVYNAQDNSLYLIDQGKRLIRFDFPN